MRLGADDDALVVELGANHAGEIAYLGSLVEPTVAVITNAGAAHLEGFGSIAGVAAAKGELIDALADDGVAVLNADDEYFAEWRQRARGRRVVSFGLGPDADVRPVAEPVVDRESSLFTIALPAGRQVAVRLPLLGRANVANALAAAAAASAAGASNADIAAGLGRARPVKGRMNQLPGPRGSTVIDDTYNANPSAARAALDYLSAQSGRRIAVLGDMLELGDESLALHAAVGEYARGRIDALITVGELAGAAAEAFGPQAQRFASIEPATAAVSALLGPDVTVLVKASRSMGLERLVAAVLATGESGEC
jgi:UDP-N-acetylmuramoyl-tripeptide--D-alanyl-D-alanine ligase